MTLDLSKTLPSSIKALKSSAIIFAIAATSSIAPSAFASNLVETKLTVKISTADLADADGVEKTYARLQKRATSFCKRDSSTLYFLNESVEDCVEDLMEQFITTSKAAPLKAHHEKVAELTMTEKFAMN